MSDQQVRRFLSMQGCCALKNDLTTTAWPEVFQIMLSSLQTPTMSSIFDDLDISQYENTMNRFQHLLQENSTVSFTAEVSNPLILNCTYSMHGTNEERDCSNMFAFLYSNDGISVGFNFPPSSEAFTHGSSSLRLLDSYRQKLRFDS